MKTKFKIQHDNLKNHYKYNEKSGFFGYKEYGDKKIVFDSQVIKKISNNNNLRNNQNYILSNKKISNILRINNNINSERIVSNKFLKLNEGELYYLNNNDLNKVDNIKNSENLTLFIFMLITLITISILLYNYNPFYLIFLSVFIILISIYLFNRNPKRYIKLEKKFNNNYMIYFIRDTEGIYYYIK